MVLLNIKAMKKLILVIGISFLSIVSFSQTINNDTIVNKNSITPNSYSEDMKNQYHKELGNSMSNWAPERVIAFRKIFVYSDFTPISKDTLYYHYPSLKEN
jgi:hypothetical protein